jgi:hypothetical protein
VTLLVEHQTGEDGGEATGHVWGDGAAPEDVLEGVTGGISGLATDPGEGDGSVGAGAEADAFEVSEDFIGGHGMFSSVASVNELKWG